MARQFRALVLVAGCYNRRGVGWLVVRVCASRMLGDGCCSRSLGFLLLYFMAWAFTVCWIYWASLAGPLLG
ncbi:hypothetical protein DVH24_021605 [Malus domestica]|uniref:Uncharacterized protein n=1 Tax=Malus domestica TaxID=3750 RepID=A0A498K0I7_MALDO|nr:hypothetical protein DVH24_021605 [Malus domestica]